MMQDDIRFRQYKLLIWDAERKKRGWMVLNRLVGYAIKDHESLDRALVEVSETHSILRVFQTASTFSDPMHLRGAESRDNRLLKSYMVLESDKDINYNIRLAQYLYGELTDRGIEPLILYTGGKSIHLIFEFHFMRYLGTRYLKLINLDKTMPFDKRIWLEKVARYNFLSRTLPEQLPDYGFDFRTALDPFRIHPVIGSLNKLSSRTVVELEAGDLLATKEWIFMKSL